MNQTKNTLFLALAFMIVGLATVFFTHEPIQSNNIVVQENYIKQIEPWIDLVYFDQSLTNVSNTKNNFLNFHSPDRSIGQAHLSLFLAFDAWEKFLLTGDVDDKQQSIKHFSRAAELLPNFNLKWGNLENILKQQDV